MYSFIHLNLNFGASLSTEHVWDAFTILALLDDSRRTGNLLEVPHTGDQSQQFIKAMEARNTQFVLYGQPDAVHHICDKCAWFFEYPSGDIRECLWQLFVIFGTHRPIGYCQAIVGDGLSMGRPCCGEFRCTILLSNQKHRYCPEHFGLHDQCAIDGCNSQLERRR